jgi:hypothetical protein
MNRLKPTLTLTTGLICFAMTACGTSTHATVTVTEQPTTEPEQSVTDSTDATEVQGKEGVRRCAKLWNQTATDAQLRELAFASLVDPIRRDKKATAWVDGWNFGLHRVALIGPGRRGAEARVKPGQCLVASGPDVGKVYLQFGRRWEQISGDSPTEAAYPAVMMAKAGANSWIRRDGTVLPIVDGG